MSQDVLISDNIELGDNEFIQTNGCYNDVDTSILPRLITQNDEISSLEMQSESSVSEEEEAAMDVYSFMPPVIAAVVPLVVKREEESLSFAREDTSIYESVSLTDSFEEKEVASLVQEPATTQVIIPKMGPILVNPFIRAASPLVAHTTVPSLVAPFHTLPVPLPILKNPFSSVDVAHLCRSFDPVIIQQTVPTPLQKPFLPSLQKSLTSPFTPTQQQQLVSRSSPVASPFAQMQQQRAAVPVRQNPFIAPRNPFIAPILANPFMIQTPSLPPVENVEQVVSKRVEEELSKIKKKRRKRSNSVTEPNKMDYKTIDVTKNGAIGGLIPKGMVLIETRTGNYVVPLYDKMPAEEQQRIRNSFKTLYKSLNITWKDKHEIEVATSDESLTNIDVRYQETVRYIKQQNGCNFPKLFMMFCWGAIEIIASKMGINAEGYFTAQLQLADIYESKMTQMGSISGFGEDWPVWIQLVVLSGTNLIMIILLNKFLKGYEGIVDKAEVMRGVSGFISGKTSSLAIGEDGVPKPTTDPVSNALGMNLGGLNMTNLLSTGLSSFFGSGDDDAAEKQKPKKKKKRAGRTRITAPKPYKDNSDMPEEV